MWIVLLAVLSLAETKQIIWVKPTGGIQTQLELHQKSGGAWKKMDSWPAVIGAKSFADFNQKKEGDMKTPSGLYDLEFAMGTAVKIESKIKYVQVTPEDKWVDDPESPEYNKWIRGNTKAKSFETMLRKDKQYDLLLVIRYNMGPIVPGNGSAIFAHVWRSDSTGTAGCVAMEKKNLEKLLEWLDPSHNPKILLSKTNEPIEGWSP